MPIYDYNCPHCFANFEKLAKMSENSKKRKCPFCGKFANKIPSIPSVVTDTSFWGLDKQHYGTTDINNPNDVLTSRADYHKRMDDNNLRELDRAELEHPKMPTPKPCM